MSLPGTKIQSKLLFLAGIAISGVFLWLALRNVEFNTVWQTISKANLWWSIPFVIGYSTFLWWKAYRWSLLLCDDGSAKTGRLLPPVVIGYASNILLPAQLGELVRVYLARRDLGIELTPMFVTIVLERMFDFLAIIFIVGIVLVFTDSATSNLVVAGYIAGLGGLALVTLVVTYVVWTAPIHRVLRRGFAFFRPARREQLDRQLELITRGLTSLRDLRRLSGIMTVSFLQWGLMGLCIYCAILAIGIDAPTSAGFVVLVATVVGLTLPSAPGFFGAVQLSFTLGLTPFGVSSSAALSASIVFHAWLLLCLALGAFVFLHLTHNRLSGILRHQQSARSLPQTDKS